MSNQTIQKSKTKQKCVTIYLNVFFCQDQYQNKFHEKLCLLEFTWDAVMEFSTTYILLYYRLISASVEIILHLRYKS